MPDPHDDPKVRRIRRRDRDPDTPPDLEVAALGYEAGQDNAPKLIAHGRGHMAQRIMELAEQHDLPVRQDPTLVSILGALDVGAEVPPDLYGVIAEVLAWAYHADQEAADRRRRAA
ncbi:MAG: EscU/YscU/HrcU family type III secretion system export apparatus switch protein [Thermoleophilia bacterium]|nr:EscU/YscU/HrcU family type III secretion system export apparatus switch protein [Thermoleophilia bacterium]